MLRISKEDACNFIIRYQSLDCLKPLSGMGGILDYIGKVGCIQYDPLNIVARNADLVLQSRIFDFRPEMLEQLLYKDRLLIDGWDKMMSIYPAEDWAHFHFVREKRSSDAICTLSHRKSEDALLYLDTVLKALAENGAMLPRQIPLGSANSGRWGHRNLSSAALDYLFHAGKVGVANKINVNKVYDLIENLLPARLLTQANPFKTEYDFKKWYVYRRLGSVGMLWNKNGGAWLATLMGNKTLRQRIFDEYIEEKSVECVEIEGISEKFYVRCKDMYLFDAKPTALPEGVRFLAPLDNSLWDRDMVSKIFGFNYTWEVYVPAAKRKYGYYVLPVLCGNRFIARFEPEKSKTHIRIKNWWWEKDVSVTSNLVDLVLREMERFALCFDKSGGVHESVGMIIRN
ncbi:MAG: winged helix DNA-binding domain-containing protein [Oscillospiraceae bacterium]|nr:winged helix DNA-binding domain-containing protein [Oscillospiraceae bacterium]